MKYVITLAANATYEINARNEEEAIDIAFLYQDYYVPETMVEEIECYEDEDED